MKLRSIRFEKAVTQPGKGGNTSTTFYTKAAADPQTPSVRVVRSIEEVGAWIVLTNDTGDKRLSHQSNVVDAECYPESKA